MRRMLSLALALCLIFACTGVAGAQTVISPGAITMTIDATVVQQIGWAYDQNITDIYVYPTSDGLRVEAPYEYLSTRGNYYDRYFDVPITINVAAGKISSVEGQPLVKLYVDRGYVQTFALSATNGAVNAQSFNVSARIYARPGGVTSVIQAVYTDASVSESSGLFFSPDTAAAKTVYFIDRGTLTSWYNAVAVRTVGVNANRSRAEWSPGIDAVRVFIDYMNLQNVTVYRVDNGVDYRLVDTKVTLLKNGVPYPASTPVLVELNPLAEIPYGEGTLKGKMKLNQDYFFDVVYENDRAGYLSADGSFTLRFFLRDDPDVVASFSKIFDLSMTTSPIAVYIQEPYGGYSEKRFDYKANASYEISTGGITMPGNLTLSPGQSIRLSVLYGNNSTLDKIVFWTSSDPSVLAVAQDGTITALRDGVSVVVARTSVEGYEAYCVVTVSSAAAPTTPVIVAPYPSGASQSYDGVLYVVTADRLGKYTGPGTSYARMRSSLLRGDIIAVIDTVGGYARFRQGGVICYSDASGMQPYTGR